MLLNTLSRAGLLCLYASCYLVTISLAKDGRDFAGHYALTDVSEKDGQIEVTLHLDLYNYSGQDLSQVAVLLRAHPEPGVIGRFPAVDNWRDGGKAVLSQLVRVNRREYERWLKNGQPNVFIVYRDRDGQTWERTAQLNSSPAGGL